MDPDNEDCVCGHPVEFHISRSGSLPMCLECSCLGPKRVPEWIRKLGKRAT